MGFSPGFPLIKDPILGSNLAQTNAKDKELLNVAMISGDDESIDTNLLSWKISSVTSRLITLELEFSAPLAVSSGEYPDQLAI